MPITPLLLFISSTNLRLGAVSNRGQTIAPYCRRSLLWSIMDA